jgi:hypothetical protein
MKNEEDFRKTVEGRGDEKDLRIRAGEAEKAEEDGEGGALLRTKTSLCPQPAACKNSTTFVVNAHKSNFW